MRHRNTIVTAEQRVAPRVAVRAKLEIGLEDGWLAANAKDLSTSGLCVILGAPLEKSQNVIVRLKLESDDSTGSVTEVRARVVWCTSLGGDYQVGLQFFGLSRVTQLGLNQFVRYLKSSTSGPTA